VIRWIDKGHLKGFKLPGRGNNRVSEESLLDFLSKQGIPIPDELNHNVMDDEPKVLIVDDDDFMAKALKRVVTGQGLKVEVAHDGFEAGQKLFTFSPNLVLLDLQMPGVDGFSVIKSIKKQINRNIYVIVISAQDQTELNQAIEIGADVYLQKPFENEELRKVIKQGLLNLSLEKSY